LKIVTLNRVALGVCAAAVLLAGCGGSQAPIGALEAMPQSSGSASAPTGVHRRTTSSYRVVYRFRRTNDGGRPGKSLIDVNGKLYGTTRYGGGGSCSYFEGIGCGTVYQLDPKSGRKKVLYSFRGGSTDGAYPVGGLIDVNGTLYGTTTYAGGGCGDYPYGCGTVYSISTSGKEEMLHSFSFYDGSRPFAGLIDVNGTLYGTTEYGGTGSCGCGIVYSISTSGSEKILYNFAGKPDGGAPAAGLIDVEGTLYGTTIAGGSSSSGTVYSITTTGAEKVLHSFTDSPDGASPTAGLIDVKGTLYGTTYEGGNKICLEIGPFACGIVYSITTTGKEKVLYSFTPYNSAAYYPYAGLVSVKGIMYGTTAVGGGGYGCNNDGCGMVYSVSTTGHETVLHVFHDGDSDGASPDATSTMTDVDGVLYGTTPNGGGSNCPSSGTLHLGCGTVFALTP
jgi:uncharacterized repeat protein (TIGR03803 family)